ncbi:hypothetical protein [Lysinibacillus sp. BW-2-10]|uniref:hypothetical protein n=1 Tax=Lysinibacillus sp. BW-2-10 TaxID=2590030 RepID=UPI0011804832|nr:hypothetical protein [Lysinibacillus sp. BW-2-10]TSI02536.1 hypothetical protein FJQ64_18245 [Lysinibacillus sp. BW-2-10]
MKRRQFIKVGVICLFCTLFLLWVSGWLNLWLNGMSVIGNDVDGYYLQTYPVEGEYTVTIDLSNLKSNEGKVLYDDGTNQIYIETVFIHNESEYQVSFRSSGTYSLKGATLVSGIEHARTVNGFTKYDRVNAQATYQGKTYKLYPSVLTGLNYKDGDSFGIYLILNDEEGTKVEIDREEKMEIKLSNLYMHIWEKN